MYGQVGSTAPQVRRRSAPEMLMAVTVGADRILEIWQEARAAVLGPERRADFLQRDELRELASFPPEDLRQAFTRTSLLSEALAWLRDRDQTASHGRAPTNPVASPGAKAALAASMRDAPTPAEARLWSRLEDGVLGHTACRQWQVDGWIVDFAVPDAEVLIEVDGSVHEARRTADKLRDDQLRADHFEVLRFTNDDIERDLDQVVDTITSTVRDRLATFDPRREAAVDLQLAADMEKLRAARQAIVEERKLERLALNSHQPPRPGPNPTIQYRCDACDHEFRTRLHPPPQCRTDGTHEVWRQCREPNCKAWTALSTERCPRCAEARDVAKNAAGRGARSQSQLKQAKRGKGWTGRS